MKIFVTGATGFIGSHFVKLALQQGHEVIALRRSDTSSPKIDLEQQPQWLCAQMYDVAVDDLIGVDVMVHLAAHSANVPYDTLANCLYWNVNVPLALLEKALEAKVGSYVVAGSCFEYGTSAERYDFIPADAPLEPTQTYPASKAAASIALRQWAIQHAQCLSYLRIFQVYGEGEAESRLWPSLRKSAQSGADLEMTKAEQVRDFINVEEVAEKLLACCSKTPPAGQPLIANLGSGKPQTLKEFAEFWWKEWQAQGELKIGVLPYRQGEVMRYVPLLGK